MKLLHIVDTLDPKMGGVSQAVKTMSEEVNKIGLSNEVLTLDATEKFTEIGLVKVTCLGPSARPWNYNKNLIPWLLDNLNRFDSIIVHGLWLYKTYAVRQALKIFVNQLKRDGRMNKPPALYIMPHGMLDPYFQRSQGRMLKAIRNWFYWKLIEGKVVNGASGLLFTCKEECKLAAIPFSPYRPKRELVIGMGIKEPPGFTKSMTEAFLQVCPQLRNHNYLLFLGRIDNKKGVDLLIKAYLQNVYELKLEKLSRHDDESNAELDIDDDSHSPGFPNLVIAGPGLDTKYGRMMGELVNNSPILRKKVVFSGMLEGLQKWGAYYGSSAFVLSSHQENFGIAVVEALACSKPVIISNQVNIWSEIKEAGAGIIGDDSFDGTYKALKTWLKFTEIDRLRMEKQSRKCFEKHFALDAATSRLINALSYKG